MTQVASPHILLVEDSETQALKLTAMFEEKGWEASWCDNAEKALLFLEERIPDVLLVDYFLPGMQGDAFCRMVRIKRSTRNIPVMMLTSVSGNPREWVLGCGANDFIASNEDFSKAEIFADLFSRTQALLRAVRE